MNAQFDYVIVGAGSAGCVLADRLSADGKTTVLVLEFGGSDRSVLIQMPSALSYPMNMKKYDWRYYSEPEEHLGGRRMHTPRGKVLGGSSSINGMVYVRGNPMDFERWHNLGAQGWDYAHVLPYFQRAETRQEGGDAYRGGNGPLNTKYGTLKNPLYSKFAEAAQQAGYPFTADYNGAQQEGFGRMDMTVHKGRRWSAANAYLKPAMKRRNLTVETHALADKLLFEGTRAVGVRYVQGGEVREVRAAREVIVASGPINSPALLQRSGIGAAEQLKALGIEVVQDLPGVGENLQDHLEFYFQMECTQPITLFSAMGPIAKARIGAQWLALREGLGATNHFESCGFIRSRAGIEYPDIQYHFLPLAVSYDGSSMADRHGYQAHVGPMRSRSRGTVRLRSDSALDTPEIRFNYMSHAEDWEEMRACVRLTREIFAQEALAPYTGREMQPGTDVVTDEQIDAFVRDNVESAYHPSCTCKMGADGDPMAVLAPDLRVRGVQGLRVIDSSAMPAITTGNLNAPTIMLAERGADLVMGRETLAASEMPFVRSANWQTTQR